MCYLVEPKHSDESDNEVHCPTGILVDLPLPSSYVCGPVKVRAEARTTDNTEFAATSGVTADNCALDPTDNFSIASDGTATWDAVSEAVSYKIEVAAGGSSAIQVVTVTGATTVNLISASNCCLNGEQYRARIRAVKDNSNLGAWSSWEDFDYNGRSTLLGTPVPFTVTLDLSYDYGTGLLWITLASSKVVDLNCEINGESLPCSAGRRSIAKAADAEYIVTASATYGGVTKTAEVTLVVPASPGPAATATAPPENAPIVRWADGFPSVRFSQRLNRWQVGMKIETDETEPINGKCTLVDPKRPGDLNEATCHINSLSLLRLPDDYTCGVVEVSAEATWADDSGDSYILSGFTPYNCPLTPTLELNYDYTNSLLQINAQSNYSAATLTCQVDDDDAIPCDANTTVSKPAGATYSVTLTASVENDEESVTWLLVVPASPGPAVTSLPPLEVGFDVVSYSASFNSVLVEPTSNRDGATAKCRVKFLDNPGESPPMYESPGGTGGEWNCNPGSSTSQTLGNVCGNLVVHIQASEGSDSAEAFGAFRKPCAFTLTASISDFAYNSSNKKIFYKHTNNYGMANLVCSFTINGGEIDCGDIDTFLSHDVTRDGTYVFRLTVSLDGQTVTDEKTMIVSNDREMGATATPVPDLTVAWEDDSPQHSLVGGAHRVFFLISTNRTASGKCYLVSPAHPDDDDNEVNCPPGVAANLVLPSSYTCGPIEVRAEAEAVDASGDTAEITGVARNNLCMGSIIVDRSEADIVDDGGCSLAEAIINANDGAQTHDDCESGGGDDTITLTVDVELQDNNRLSITDSLTIEGGDKILSGSDGLLIFRPPSGSDLTATINRLNVTLTSDGTTYADLLRIEANATVAIKNSVFYDIHTSYASVIDDNSDSIVTIDNSVFRDIVNDSGTGGAILTSGEMTITNSLFSNNSTPGGSGGVIYGGSNSRLDIYRSVFAGNSARWAGGAIYSSGICARGEQHLLRQSIWRPRRRHECPCLGYRTPFSDHTARDFRE